MQIDRRAHERNCSGRKWRWEFEKDAPWIFIAFASHSRRSVSVIHMFIHFYVSQRVRREKVLFNEIALLEPLDYENIFVLFCRISCSRCCRCWNIPLNCYHNANVETCTCIEMCTGFFFLAPIGFLWIRGTQNFCRLKLRRIRSSNQMCLWSIFCFCANTFLCEFSVI